MYSNSKDARWVRDFLSIDSRERGAQIVRQLYLANHVELSTDGTKLRYNSCIFGPDSKEWLTASVEEFRRLITETMQFVSKDSIPLGQSIAYYNPQVKVKRYSRRWQDQLYRQRCSRYSRPSDD